MGKRPRQGSKATRATDGPTGTATATAVAERHDSEGPELQEKDGTASSLEDASHRLTRAASRPEDFFRPSHQVAQELTEVLRQLFAFARRSETQRKPFGPLEELYVDGLDCESIWAELELRNAPLEKHARRTMARLVESEDISLAADIESDDEQPNDHDEDEDDGEDSEDGGDGDEHEAGGDREDKKVHFSDDRGGRKTKISVREGRQEGRQGSDVEEEDVKGLATSRRKQKHKQKQDGDMFFDADDMDKFADEGAMEDDLDGGVLDEMYGGGEAGDGDSSSENDEGPGLPDDLEDEWDDDDEKGTRMGQMLEDMEDKVGGGISHEDFFGSVSSSRKKGVKNGGLQAKTSGSKNKKSNRDEEEEDEEDEEEEEDALNSMDDGEDEDADVARDGGEEDASENSSDDESLTGHAAYSKRMKGRINDQEKELLAEKPWALRGEIHSNDRPENSLLEATVDVDRATRAAPLPTPERAMTLLDMIKKRCLHGNWDDVTPRNIATPTVRKEAPHLSQDKSKEALGELYEKEFLKQTMGVEEGDPQAPVKTELKQLFAKLCNKLDALCNFHYTPKTVIPEMKVQADVAAIAMEEVLPSSVADADALAPEEIYAKKRGRDAEFLEAEEMDQMDRKRVRSSKKAARRKARRQVEAEKKLVSKLNPGLGNKYEKSKMLKDIHSAKNVTTHTGDESTGREFSTSAKFFTKLEEKVKAGVKSMGQEDGGADAKSSKGSRAAQYRL